MEGSIESGFFKRQKINELKPHPRRTEQDVQSLSTSSLIFARIS